jgi:hypothetical protein
MSTAGIAARVSRLERASLAPASTPEECLRGPVEELIDAGEPLPTERCPLCGGLHVLVVVEEVVTPGDRP